MLHAVTMVRRQPAKPRVLRRASVPWAVRAGNEGADAAHEGAADDARRMTGAADDAADAGAWLAAIAAHADRGAFARLFRAYAPKVKGHLVARGATVGVADELTQDVMLTVWRKAAQFDASKGTVAAWLYTITRNRLFNHLRDARYPQPEIEAEAAADDDAARPDEQLASAQRRARLGRALGQLPPEQHAVLRDAYWRGQTLKEHADEQQLPLGTVKTRVRLALAHLRTILGGENADDADVPSD
jgi:RNA polymerase sigma factor (sigma-70 family)